MNKKSSETNVFRMLGERGEPKKRKTKREMRGFKVFGNRLIYNFFVYVEKCAQKIVLNVGGEKERRMTKRKNDFVLLHGKFVF